MEVNEHDGRFEQNAAAKGCKRQRSERGRIDGAEHSVGTMAGKELFRITFGNFGVLSSELIKHISRKDFIRFQNELLLKLGV